MESIWSVSKLSTESVGSHRELGLVENFVRTSDVTQLDSFVASAVCIGHNALYKSIFTYLFTYLLAGCEYGDKNPTWCAEGRKSDCYDPSFSDTCCETCAEEQGTQTECEYGDKASWCATDIQAPAWQCYDQHDSCCETCKRFETNIQGQES